MKFQMKELSGQFNCVWVRVYIYIYMYIYVRIYVIMYIYMIYIIHDTYKIEIHNLI
jgi:hypothetical protein